MNPRPRLLVASLSLLLAAASALALFLPRTGLAAAAGLALLTLLPGLALAGWLFPAGAISVGDRLALSVAFSLALASAALLALAGGAVRLTPAVLLACLAGSSALFLGAAWRRGGAAPEAAASRHYDGDQASPDWLTLAILAGAAWLRLRGLGYSEFQGDEAGNCLANALALLNGKASALLTAHRPPVQVLLPAAVKLLTGSLREGWVRFPFALAGVAGVWLVYSLTRQLAGRGAARVAMALAALCGFLVAFSRMVQYQSLVALFMLCAFFFLRRFQAAESPRAAERRLLAAAAVFGFGALVHYEALLMLPVFVYAAGARLGWSLMHGWRLKAAVVLIFAAFALPFYLPFLAHPAFNETLSEYQATRYSASLHFNWDALWITGAFYNSRIYLVILLVLSLPLPWLWRRAGAGGRLLLAWFAIYFLWYMVVCKWPKTHLYTFFVPWVMLAGLGWERLAAGWGALVRRLGLAWGPLRRNTAAACLALPALWLAGAPLEQKFVSHAPEYVWTRPLLPQELDNVFGFPYHRGWKTAGWLYRTGVIPRDYITNERDKLPTFYLRVAPAGAAKARTLLRVLRPQSFRDLPPPAGFHLAARVTSGGEPAIEIYTRQAPAAAPRLYRAEEYDERVFALKD